MVNGVVTTEALDLYSDVLGEVPAVEANLAPAWHGRDMYRRFLYQHRLAALLANRVHDGYGDAQGLVDAILDGVLAGFGWTVPGSQVAPEPELLPVPSDESAAVMVDRLNADLVQRWVGSVGEVPDRQAVTEALAGWAERTRFVSRFGETVRNAVSFGDGVFTLTWNADKHRPEITVYDPGMYFPVIPEDGSFPNRVHVAWADSDENTVTRLTWELVDLEASVPAGWGGTRTQTCLFTEAVWPLSKVRSGADTFDLADAIELRAEDLDLEIDWLPVYHLTAAGSTAEHYGTSLIAPVYQALVDLSAADKDVRDNSALVAVPAAAYTSEAPLPSHVVFEPGMLLWLGQTGAMNAVDLSAALPTLLEARMQLQGRIRGNARIPAEVWGTGDSSTAASGRAMELSLARFESLVGSVRERIAPTAALALKHVVRWLRWDSQLSPGPDVIPSIGFGGAVPADIDGAVTRITALYERKIISRETALRLLAAAGLDIDPGSEAQLAASEDMDSALALLDVTGNRAAASERLGVDPVTMPGPELGLPG